MAQRADIVVLDKEGRPALLVECKAPEVPVSRLKNRGVFDQAVRYNSVVGASFVAVTNGMELECYALNRESFTMRRVKRCPIFQFFMGFSSWSMYSSCQSGRGAGPFPFEPDDREAFAFEQGEAAQVVRGDVAIELIELQDLEAVPDQERESFRA